MNDKKETVARRTMLGATAALGSLAAAATLLPASEQPKVVEGAAKPDDAAGAQGYRLTEHIKRYYATARV